MPTNFDLAEAAINFTAGTEATWNAFVLPIPENVVVYTVDTKKFKKGDGNHRFSELEDGPSIAGIASGEETVVNVLTQLEAGDEDSIIAISNEIYDASATKLNDLIARLNALANSNTVQTANMDAADLQFGLVNSTITNSDNGKLAVVIGHDMSAGVLPDTLSVQAPVNPINIRSFDFYSDKACTNKITDMYHSSTYYANVHVQHDTADIDNITIQLVDDNNYVTVENIERGLFKIIVGQPVVDGTVQLTATATYNTDTVSINKSLNIHAYVPMIVAIYGKTGDDNFYGVATDSQDNIICCGSTSSEGVGSNDALIVKFDSSLNILAKKRYGGGSNDVLQCVTVDSQDNIICAGFTGSEGTGCYEVLIVKFDNSLNIIAKKYYNGNANNVFIGVTTDTSGNIYCVGDTIAEGAGYSDAIVIKLDSSLNIIAKKRYGGSSADSFQGIVVNGSSDIYVVGYTTSEGSGNYDALIVKFDSSLNIVVKKLYGGSGRDYFNSVVTDTSGNVYAAGWTAKVNDNSKALIVKFDSSLNILAHKIYGGVDDDIFEYNIIDSQNNIICVGNTYSEGIGSTTHPNALVVKFDSSLNILARKIYGGAQADFFYSCIVDNSDNIICVGYTSSEGSGGKDALVTKLPSNIPSGTITGTVLTGLTLADSTLTLADSTLTLADSALTLANSILTLTDSNLTLADSNLTFERDIIAV